MDNEHLKIVGRVTQGQKKGLILGFPTANINFTGKLSSGVYAGKVTFEGKEYEAAVVYFGEKCLLEAHLLDFEGNLYNKEIEVEILEKVRDIIKFKNNQELIEQIKKDIEIIKNQ